MKKVQCLSLPHKPCEVYEVRPITPDQRKISAPLPRASARALLQSNGLVLLCNAASAKVWKGGAEIFYWSGGAGDDVVDVETLCAEAKARGSVDFAEPCPWDQ